MEKKDHVLLGAALTVGAVEGWLDEHVDPETGYVVDDTLAIEGAAADSKATGEAIAAVEAAIPAVDATLATTGAAADAKKTGDEIADLKSAIKSSSEQTYDIKKYLFYTLSSGYISGDGSIISAQSPEKEVYTNHIPASAGDRIYVDVLLTSSAGMWVAYAAYDANDDFISRTALYTGTSSHYNGDFIVPGNTHYIALTYRTYGNATLTLTTKWNEFDSRVNALTKNTSKNAFVGEWEPATYNNTGMYIYSSSAGYVAVPPCISVGHGKTYTASWGDIESNNNRHNIFIYLHQFDSSGTRVAYNSYRFDSGGFTVTVGSSTVNLGVSIYDANSTPAADWNDLVPSWFQIENGSTSTQYVPHEIFKSDLIDAASVLSKTAEYVIPYNLPSNTVKTIAHRGDDIVAPQCTAPAYILARKHGHKIAENDLQTSEDGEYVMWHDTSLSLLGNMVDINGYLMYTDGTDFYWIDPSDNSVYTWDGTDYVASATSIGSLTRCAGSDYGVNSSTNKIGLPLSVLKRIDFGAYKGSQFAGTQILTFSEWVSLCKKLGMEIYIDTKLTYTDAIITECANIVKALGMAEHASWLGLAYAQMVTLRSIIADARIGVLQHPTAQYVSDYAYFNTGRGFFFNGDAKNGMTEAAIQLGLNAGFEVEVWLVDTTSYTKDQIFDTINTAVSYGVTGITLDHYRCDEAFAYLLDQY